MAICYEYDDNQDNNGQWATFYITSMPPLPPTINFTAKHCDELQHGTVLFEYKQVVKALLIFHCPASEGSLRRRRRRGKKKMAISFDQKQSEHL